jgi:hypothetical protein
MCYASQLLQQLVLLSVSCAAAAAAVLQSLQYDRSSDYLELWELTLMV